MFKLNFEFYSERKNTGPALGKFIEKGFFYVTNKQKSDNLFEKYVIFSYQLKQIILSKPSILKNKAFKVLKYET